MFRADSARLPETVAFLQSVWAEVLNVPVHEIFPDANFLDTGGDSIAAVLCLNRIRSVYKVDIEVGSLLVDTMTLRGLASVLAEKTDAR